MSGFDLKDYVDVAERIQQFYAKFPDGSLQSEIIELTDSRVVVRSWAYRTPEDPKPASGMSQLNIPGSTPYTKGSEIENAETSAVGRAIAMLGFAVKGGIASRQEVMNKQHTPATAPQPGTSSSPAGASVPEMFAGRVDKGRPPVDQNLRKTPDGSVFGFVLMEDTGGKYSRKTQVVCVDALAEAAATAFVGIGVPETATVWGKTEMVPWENKDGKAMPPFRRVHATRIETPDWTLPATDTTPAPVAGPDGPTGAVEDLSDLPW